MKTYSYKLQHHKKNKTLHRKITVAGIIWNRLVEQQQRHRSIFYRQGVEPTPEQQALFEKMRENKRYKGKPYSAYRSYNLLQRMRNGNTRFGALLRELQTASIQVQTERVQTAFKLFFTKLKRGDKNLEPVRFKRVREYPSVGFKSGGYKFLPSDKIMIMGEVYSYHGDRHGDGAPKTLTVKRDAAGEIRLYIVTGDTDAGANAGTDRPIVGIDFWVKPLMSMSNGETYEMPLFYAEQLDKLRELDKKLSSKREAKKAKDAETGERTEPSGKYKKLKLERFRVFRRIVNKRKEHHIQLARELAQRYSAIAVPEVPLHSLARRYHNRRHGVTIGDIGYSYFIQWLQAMCDKFGSELIKVPKNQSLVKTCSCCGILSDKKTLDLKWTCEACGAILDRGINTASNLEKMISRNISE